MLTPNVRNAMIVALNHSRETRKACDRRIRESHPSNTRQVGAIIRNKALHDAAKFLESALEHYFLTERRVAGNEAMPAAIDCSDPDVRAEGSW